MDSAYLHIVTNHIPIVGVPFVLLVLVLGIWRKSDELKSVALLVFTLLGIVTLGVYLLGQGGKEFVEHLAGISLGGHWKTGHRWSLQNRPMESGRDERFLRFP